MSEKPQPDRVPDDETPPHPAEPLQIDTPVIDIQDLEHKPGTDTRVSNKGVKIEPTLDGNDLRDFATEDLDVVHVMREFKKVLHEQLASGITEASQRKATS
ncbi:MAG TPA: hypothetical protein VGO61_03475 [Steroidobacteraceae bacterium]|jgi:hypothetical protein|nr:hypothetical protein [Steroidobacteraceae bacterium]